MKILNVQAAYMGLPQDAKSWDESHYKTFLGRMAKSTNFVIENVIDKPKEIIGQAGHATFFATGANFPDSVRPILEKYRSVLYTDDAWEAAFRMVDMTNIPRDGFRVNRVSAGLTFEAVEEGAKAKVYSASGTDFLVRVDRYGGGMQWSRTLIDDQEYWTLEDNTVFFLNKSQKARADAAYAMIEAISSSRNLAWQNPVPATLANTDPNYAAIRDFETINKAIIDMMELNKDKGYGITVDSPVLILAPLALKPRLDRAMGILNGQLAGVGFSGVRFNVSIRYTMSLKAKDKYYVCIPGIQNYWIDRQRLQVFTQFDPASYSDCAFGWMRYGGMIADQQIWTRCSVA